MLGTILAVLGFLISPWGLFCVLFGVVLFLCLPLISLVSSFKAFSRFFLWLAAFPLRRVAIVVSEHDDVLFKQMRFDGLGVETITIDGEEKVFEDPDAALHYWNGLKFALANEEHGVLFDPRHAAAGMKKRLKNDRGEGEYLATTGEWETYGVSKWKPGVFEFPRVHELVNLSAVQELIDGGERSEYARRVEELYKHSQDPFGDGTPPMKYLYPVIAFAMLFFGTWLMTSQMGGPGGSAIGYGTLALVGGWNLRRGLGAVALVAVPLGIIGALAVLVNPVFALAVTFAVGLGFAFLPILTFIAKPSKMLSGALSKLYFRLGFLGFRQPVFEWTPSKYVLREADELDLGQDVAWYNLFGTIVGFTFEPGEDSWGAEPVDAEEIRAQQPVADGGAAPDSNLPAQYVPSSQLKRDTYGGYLPKRVDDAKYYLNTGILLNRFENSATGHKSLQKLLEAKDVHGGGDDGLDDATVFKATLVSGFLGAVAGIGIFILPGFL